MPRHLLGVVTVRRRYTTLNGRLRFHWTGERVASGKPTIFEHTWPEVLHQINGETHDFEGFGVPRWQRYAIGGVPSPTWVLEWPCLECGRWIYQPSTHAHLRCPS